jgi:TRAP-type mannitol/chloroaromatic compound transport system permease small subunit
MKSLSRWIDALNDRIGRFCAYSALVFMCIVLGEVFTRRVLNQPTIWTFEVIGWLYAVHFMFTLPYTLLHKGHVNVDLVYNSFSPRNRAYLSIATYIIFFFPFTLGITWYSVQFAFQAWVEQDKSWSAWQPPIYPIKTVIPVAFFLLLLQGVSEVIKIITSLPRKSGNE